MPTVYACELWYSCWSACLTCSVFRFDNYSAQVMVEDTPIMLGTFAPYVLSLCALRMCEQCPHAAPFVSSRLVGYRWPRRWVSQCLAVCTPRC